MSDQDVIVVGAGIEGLAAAALLARAGRRTLLVDRRAEPGGSATREEFHPGYKVPGVLHAWTGTRRALLAPLELESHGLAWRDEEPPLLVTAPAGKGLLIHRSPERAAAELGGDAAAYADWRAQIERYTPLVVGILEDTPPEAQNPGLGELMRIAKHALRLRRLGEHDMLELMRLAPTCARDWVEESFTDPVLATGLVAGALVGTVLGPWAAGTGALLLLNECARGAEPRGGPAALADALASACRAAGVELALGDAVRSIRVDRTGVLGVELQERGQIDSRHVLSTLDPRRTFLDLVQPGRVPSDLEDTATGWRARGATAALRLALSAPPAFAGRESESIERACTATSLDDLERGADNLKYGRLPEDPWLDLRVVSLADPGLAPEGHAVLSVLCHSVPHALEGGWTEEARTTLEERMLRSLEGVAPGVSSTIVGKELLTPLDLEERYGHTGGHPYHGELALDQLWLQRPALPLARYASPIRGLYLGGPANHPGGPFLGGAGALAARSLLGALERG